MKNINFRAWDKNKKQMVTNFVMAPTSPTWAPMTLEHSNDLTNLQKYIEEGLGIIDDKIKMALLSFVTSDYTMIDWSNYYGIDNYEVMMQIPYNDQNNNALFENDIIVIGKQNLNMSQIVFDLDKFSLKIMDYNLRDRMNKHGICNNEGILYDGLPGNLKTQYSPWRLVGNIFEGVNPELLLSKDE